MLVNVAVQLDRETQRHPCFNAPRGRGDQTGDINVPKSAEVASLLQEADWLAERVGDMAFKSRERCTERGILQSLHAKSKTPKNAFGFAFERRSLKDLNRVHGNVTEEKKHLMLFPGNVVILL